MIDYHIRRKGLVYFIITTCWLTLVQSESKLYYGQRILTDVHIVNFVDPSKHGFHIVLDEEFVKSYLQPVHMPTVYASAIALKTRGNSNGKDTKNKTMTNAQNPVTRVTKILYPEKGDPENGLLDGRTIKLLGLQERNWYYVCVEFESNVNRHEVATGASCQLRRTLDKFGKTVESTISEIELNTITDRSIAVQLVVEVDFPILLHVYLTGNGDGDSLAPTADIPTQTFVVKRSQTINVDFGPFLQSDTSYGSLCVLEEPLPTSNSFTPMGRSIRSTLEHCYFNDLKTKALDKQQRAKETSGVILHQIRQMGERSAMSNGNVRNRDLNVCILMLIGLVIW